MALDVQRSSTNENDYYQARSDDYGGLFGNNDPKTSSSASFFPSLMTDALKNETRALVAEIEQPLTGEGGEGFRSLFDDGWGRKSGETHHHQQRSPSPALDFGLNDSDGGEEDLSLSLGGGGGNGGGNQSGGEDLTDLELEDVEIGTVVQTHLMERFVHIASQNFEIDVGLQVIVKRSTGEWSHAEVCAYDAWPPGGGALTLQLGDGLRKTLNLGKERHMSIVRVLRNTKRSDNKDNRGLRGPVNQNSVSPTVIGRKQPPLSPKDKDDRISLDFSLSDNLPITHHAQSGSHHHHHHHGNSGGHQGGHGDDDGDYGGDGEQEDNDDDEDDDDAAGGGNGDYYITNKIHNDSFGSPKRTSPRPQSPELKSSLLLDRQNNNAAPPSSLVQYNNNKTENNKNGSRPEDDNGGRGVNEKEQGDNLEANSDAAMIPLVRRADGDKCTDEIAKKEYRSLANGESVSKGSRLLVQRSDGAWSFATVDKVDSWPPEGGTVTVRLGKTTRKALDLSKPHHCRRLRVPRQNYKDIKGPRLMINNATAVPFERADFGACVVLDGQAMNCVPRHAHVALENASSLKGKVAIVTRGVCPFAEKTKRLIECGVIGIVFVNSSDDLTVPTDPDHLCEGVNIPIILVAHSVAAHLVNNTHLYQLPDSVDASKHRCSKLLSAATSTSIEPSQVTELCAAMTLSDWITIASIEEGGGVVDLTKSTPLPQSNILHMLCANKALDLPIIEAFQTAIKTCRDDRSNTNEPRPDVLSALASAKNSEGILPLHLLCANSRACAKGASIIGAVAAFYPPSFHFKDTAGVTPFSLLAKLGHLDAANLASLLERFPIVSSKNTLVPTPPATTNTLATVTQQAPTPSSDSDLVSGEGTSTDDNSSNSNNNSSVVAVVSNQKQEDEDNGLASEVVALKRQLAELMKHTEEMESEVHTLREVVTSKDSVLGDMSNPTKESSSTSSMKPTTSKPPTGSSQNKIAHVEQQQHHHQQQQSNSQSLVEEDKDDNDDDEDAEEDDEERESDEYEMLHNFSAPASPESSALTMSDTVRREVENQVKQMAEEMAKRYRRKEEELKEHEKKLEEEMIARDQRIAMMERQVDTLAAQCDVDKSEVLNGELLAWLKQSGLEDFALIFAALGVDSLDDILDPSLVGDDELVLAGMDELDAAKFHSSRFRTAKKRREDKLKEEAEAKTKKLLKDANAVVEAAPLLSDNITEVVIEEEGEEDDEDENDNHDHHHHHRDNEYVSDGGRYEDERRRRNSGDSGGGGDRDQENQDYTIHLNDNQDYINGDHFHHNYDYDSLDDNRNENALEEVSMMDFLSQLFLPSEAQTYAAILSSLGVESPKELASVTQDMLVAAGIKKFHARKIGSAEIYRAFL